MSMKRIFAAFLAIVSAGVVLVGCGSTEDLSVPDPSPALDTVAVDSIAPLLDPTFLIGKPFYADPESGWAGLDWPLNGAAVGDTPPASWDSLGGDGILRLLLGFNDTSNG